MGSDLTFVQIRPQHTSCHMQDIQTNIGFGVPRIRGDFTTTQHNSAKKKLSTNKLALRVMILNVKACIRIRIIKFCS